jgi:2-hydroxychromene-2-carboxylate isomerase
MPSTYGAAPTLWFHLHSAFTYLRIEEAERSLAGLRWRPVAEGTPFGVSEFDDAEREAAARRMPLSWPDRAGENRSLRAAMRVALHATEVGRGAEFALAATRLAYGGGYDLDDVDVLMVAAACASIDSGTCVAAAQDARRDRHLEEAAREAELLGMSTLPVVEFEEVCFAGEHLAVQTAAAMRVAATRSSVPSRSPRAVHLAVVSAGVPSEA